MCQSRLTKNRCCVIMDSFSQTLRLDPPAFFNAGADRVVIVPIKTRNGSLAHGEFF